LGQFCWKLIARTPEGIRVYSLGSRRVSAKAQHHALRK
jgi:hypothetical protein